MTDIEEDLPADWSVQDLTAELGKNTLASAARVLRVLAARIGQTADESDDPLHLVTDLHHSLASLHEGVQLLAAQRAEPEDAEVVTRTLGALADAAEGLFEMKGWF